MKQRLGVFALVLLCCSGTGRSQAPTAIVNGEVRDSSGGAIAGAAVEVINNATGIRSLTETNNEGIYSVPNLLPGTYHIRVSKEGFKTVVHPDITLNVQDAKAIGFTLPVGPVSDTVTVEAGISLINTETVAVSTVVDRQFVENIPLNGRSFQSLITLTPGVVLTPASTLGFQGQFSVNGQRSDANTFMVDGVSGNFGSTGGTSPAAQTSGSLPGLTVFGTTQSLASVDAIQEFRVQTSTYSAEFGRQPGGQISIVTRSGTNQFHGSMFDYLRNDILDANDWFADKADQPKPPERQNDFGGTFGGPVLIPGLYNGRNRTFFFFSYEGLRLRLPQFALMNVPTLALRQNAPTALRPMLAGFPLPNGKDLGTGMAEFTAAYSDSSSLNATSIRLDHTIGQRWTVFGRYNRAPSESSVRQTGNCLCRTVTRRTPTQTTTLGVNALAQHISNELRFNYSDNFGTADALLDSFGGAVPPPRSSLIPGQYDSPAAQGFFSLNFVGATGQAQLGSGGTSFVGAQRQYNVVDNVSYGVGLHQLKFGIDYRRLTPRFAFIPYSLNIIFQSQQEVLNATASLAFVQANTPARPLYVNFSAYAQDAWKLFRRLSVDFGVRWDVNPAPDEETGEHPLAVTQVGNLSTMQLAPKDTALWRTTYKNFGPRLGIAFGVFYDTGNQQGSVGFLSFPFNASLALSNITYPPSAAQVAPPSLPNLSSLPKPYGTLSVFDPKLSLPYTLQWNVALQQGLGKKQVVTLSYVGASGRNLLQQRQLRLANINPSFTTVKLTSNNATSDYHALQAQFQRRLSRGLQALASYTWSHALDDDSVDNGTIIPVRGNAAFDIRHVFATAVTYDFPVPRRNLIMEGVLGHWSIDASLHAQSAAPVDITGTQFVNPADGTLVAARANVNPGVPFYIDDPTVPGGRKINRAAFSIPAAGQFGNLGRNVVRGFGAWQQDFALRRQFNLTEKVGLQFRAEAFNIFNHPNFGAIQTTLTAANFGQATNMLNRQLGGLNQLYQIGGPRSLQFAVKVSF